MRSRSATIQVPGSTSNLGSGFDTLGLALRLYNCVRVACLETRGVNLIAPLPDAARTTALAMIEAAAALFFRHTRQRRFGIEIELSGNVPVARGLGASATLRLGVIAGLSELTRTKLTRQDLLELVTELEGHPDNASPAIFGGFTVSGRVSGAVRCLSFPVSRKLRFVTLFPSFGISTAQARERLPASYPRADAAHALNRAALITAALASAQPEALRGLFDDRVHQPYRKPLIPQLSRVICAGEKAGALGGFLSGSGSAIICVTLQKADAVGAAMQRQLPDSDVRILTAQNEGFAVVR